MKLNQLKFVASCFALLSLLISCDDSQKKSSAIKAAGPESLFVPLSKSTGALKVNNASNGAGQWGHPKEIYKTLCAQCHGKNVAKEILGESVPAPTTKTFVRHGYNTMPAFFPTEISDQELDELALWLERSSKNELSKGGANGK